MTQRVKKTVGMIACASIFFLFVFFGIHEFTPNVSAGDTPIDPLKTDEPCPELNNLKNNPATIGGNAWNTTLGWIYHQWPADDLSSQFRVKKLPLLMNGTTLVQTGAEITGWSSYSRAACVAQRQAGTPQNCPSICWGKTCGAADNAAYGWNNGSSNFCNQPVDATHPTGGPYCMLPPVDTYYAPGTPEYTAEFPKGAHAELDYSNPQRFYSVTKSNGTTTTTIIMRDTDVVAAGIAKAKRALKYCQYPVNGWLKIRQLKEDGWVKLSGRIYSNSVPIPQNSDPGENYINWPKVDCYAHPENDVCTYRVMYDPSQKEFVGWAWSPRVRWISFSGSTIWTTGSQWQNKYICGTTCATISYDVGAGRSKWNSSFIGVWVKTLGGSIFAKKGLSGVVPPPGEVNTPYLIVTGRYTDSSTTPATQKIGAIAGWQSSCDDKNNPTCGRIGRKIFDSGVSSSANGQSGALPNLAFPTASTLANRSFIKRSMLGTIDTSGFLPASIALVPQKNAKGNLVQNITDETALWNAATSSGNGLGNTIYYRDGDLVLGDADTAKKIIQNSLISSTGAGTVVVRGNLIIKRPSEYSIDAVKNLNKLASISWIVLKRTTPATSVPPNKPADISDDDWKAGGNIIVDSCLPANNTPSLDDVARGQQVTRIVGTFFAENTLATGTGHGGKGSGECASLGNSFTTKNTIYPERGDTCSGVKKDESDGSVSCTITQTQYYDLPLEIEGILVARNILFQRVYRGRNRGSEVIINTGRMQVNPPPGLAEFSKFLPSW